jgi:uncharacterized delta-60 repeat protein
MFSKLRSRLSGPFGLVLLATAWLAIAPAAAYAAAGDLDPTFSGDGKTRTDFAGRNDDIQGIALQADGKVVGGGTARSGAGHGNFGLARYRTNGGLDPTFSGDGKTMTDIGDQSEDVGEALALQPDGKIIVAGRSGTGFGDFALVRYKPNGAVDTSFSGDGRQTTDFAGGSDRIRSMALQPDGKIVVAGQADNAAGDDNFALARYTASGALDTTFSGDGRTTTDLGGAFDSASGMAVQPDGKIVVVGTGRTGNLETSNSNDFVLARYKTNGGLDATFSGDGKTRVDVGGIANADTAEGLALQPDGKIVAAGRSNNGTGGSLFALARLSSAGDPDSTFSEDGKTTTDFANSNIEEAHAVVLQPNGRIVVGGYAQDDPDFELSAENFALARYRPNGTLETTFAGDGKQSTDFDRGPDRIFSLAVQPDGKIVAGGSAFEVINGGDDFDGEFGLARYLGG